MSVAGPSDIADRLGRELDESETRIVEARLNDAETLITARIPDLRDRITAGSLKLKLVVIVEADAVLRLIRNPDGYTTESDGVYSYRIDQGVASGRLSIEPSEWRLLGCGQPISVLTMNLGSIRQRRRPWFADWYVPPP